MQLVIMSMRKISRMAFQKNNVLSTLDFPGALFTNVQQLNGSDQVVGYFFDTSGVAHGFLFSNNKWTQFDYPGSSDTIITGINASGEMTGVYNYFHAVAHGFVLNNRQFTTVDSPFAQQSVINGLNDAGVLAGYSWDDPVNGPINGFLANGNQFMHLDMPLAQFTLVNDINSSGMVSGIFENIGGYTSGFVKLFGYLHEVNDQGQITVVNGNNNLNQVAGQTYDFTRRKWVGFAGTLPTH